MVQTCMEFPQWLMWFAINDTQTPRQIKSCSPAATPSIQHTGTASFESAQSNGMFFSSYNFKYPASMLTTKKC